MNNENVTELPAADIDRSGVPAGNTPAGIQEDGGSQPAPLGETQQLALKEVDRLRGEYWSTPFEKRDALAERISALQRHALAGGDKPADFMPAAKPAPDLRPYDHMALSEQSSPPLDVEWETSSAVTRGLPRNAASDWIAIAATAGLDAGSTKALVNAALRAQERVPAGEDGHVRLDDLSPEQLGELELEAGRVFPGGMEEFEGKYAVVEKWLGTKTSKATGKNLLEVINKHGLNRSLVAVDPGVVLTLYFAAVRDGYVTSA